MAEENVTGSNPEQPKRITPAVNKILIATGVLSFIALFVTAYLTYMHFEPSASGFCNLGEGLNCDIVNKSKWSVINLGFVEIPVSVLGFLYYLGIFIGSVGVVKRWRFQKIHTLLRPGNVIKLMTYFTYVGVLFSLYLTYIEAFKLKTFCIFCVVQQVIILAILVLFLVIGGKIKKAKKDSKVCEFC